MKIKAIYKEEVVYIMGFAVRIDKVVAIISKPYYPSGAIVDVVSVYALEIIDDKYNPYGEELQNG